MRHFGKRSFTAGVLVFTVALLSALSDEPAGAQVLYGSIIMSERILMIQASVALMPLIVKLT